ncbi:MULTISPECIES: 50S ribosomal protein L29 [unclassified Pseudodesulfovibrio]|jgi:large subunit ribosomal protein L29|uniref:50S ribosomal protein L29 n=1 Tax=unclassified Pseudodesulfovibrio TaxID=2661612 RepID=UPI000FEBEA9F|nr:MULTISPECIES: 50S ribosomal protein L29 [unclassified Pseudodesulfovibrio]MCJ2163062.1 50S ribosomal protein L29 [Pseudodesulfovibrio sp. S3-i]RWU07055.1 50S ribosomal protein L29 [Pseudodesulfovibrio sp. S3]
MTSKELRELDDAKLTEKLSESQKELFSMRFKHATAQLENTTALSGVKKTIARILTIQRERQGA